MELTAISPTLLFSQLSLGLINGSFYAILSLGLAIIFGLLNIVNFAHGAVYMMGAFSGWMSLEYLGLGYWSTLLLAPAAIGGLGAVVERMLLKRLYHLDHLYSLLLTFGLALLAEGLYRREFGSSGVRYSVPDALRGGVDLSFMYLPYYRIWVVAASMLACLCTWLVIEKTKVGALLRAGTSNAKLLQAFGVNVPFMVTLTFGFGVALAAFAGVLSAPLVQSTPAMGSQMIILVFAVVVIGGMGSILGAIVTGIGLGLVEALTRIVYPEASSVVIFVVMAAVLLLRPAGLFGKDR